MSDKRQSDFLRSLVDPEGLKREEELHKQFLQAVPEREPVNNSYKLNHIEDVRGMVPVAWLLGTRVYKELKDAEWDWRHDVVFENTGYAPEPLYTQPTNCPRCEELLDKGANYYGETIELKRKLAALEAENNQLRTESTIVSATNRGLLEATEKMTATINALEAEIERLRYFPKNGVFKTAEVILSDCGCSTEHAALLEKVRSRLFAMFDKTIAQQAEKTRVLETTLIKCGAVTEKTFNRMAETIQRQAAVIAKCEKALTAVIEKPRAFEGIRMSSQALASIKAGKEQV